MFPSEVSAPGHLESFQHLNARVGDAGGARFWFHALHNCFITVTDGQLMLSTCLTKRLFNHAPSQDIAEGCATDRTLKQLRDAAQRIVDRIDELIRGIGRAKKHCFADRAPDLTRLSDSRSCIRRKRQCLSP